MKMFIWCDVLSDYTSGIAVVMAENLEQALQLIIDKANEPSDYTFTALLNQISTYNEKTKTIVKLEKQPEIHDIPYVVAIWGGG